MMKKSSHTTHTHILQQHIVLLLIIKKNNIGDLYIRATFSLRLGSEPSRDKNYFCTYQMVVNCTPLSIRLCFSDCEINTTELEF